MDSIVELDDGTQASFTLAVEAFRFAKLKESERHHSVQGVISRGEWIYEGQSLRQMIRTLDNVNEWLKNGQQTQVQTNE